MGGSKSATKRVSTYERTTRNKKYSCGLGVLSIEANNVNPPDITYQQLIVPEDVRIARRIENQQRVTERAARAEKNRQAEARLITDRQKEAMEHNRETALRIATEVIGAERGKIDEERLKLIADNEIIREKIAIDNERLRQQIANENEHFRKEVVADNEPVYAHMDAQKKQFLAKLTADQLALSEELELEQESLAVRNDVGNLKVGKLLFQWPRRKYWIMERTEAITIVENDRCRKIYAMQHRPQIFFPKDNVRAGKTNLENIRIKSNGGPLIEGWQIAVPMARIEENTGMNEEKLKHISMDQQWKAIDIPRKRPNGRWKFNSNISVIPSSCGKCRECDDKMKPRYQTVPVIEGT